LAWSIVEGLVAAGGVELEVADESAGDEHVTGHAGDDHGGGLVVVDGSDGDGVALVDVTDASGDGDSVGESGGAEGTVRWAGFGGEGVDGGGGFPADGPVGSLVVVDVDEGVELGLEFADVPGWWSG
jgi:hypothetical protein